MFRPVAIGKKWNDRFISAGMEWFLPVLGMATIWDINKNVVHL
jgi:hypothetical protein